MGGNDGVYQVQTHSEAPLVTCGFVRLVEALENLVSILGCNAAAVIDDFEDGKAICSTD